MERTLVIVSCGKRKIWDVDPGHGPCQAKDAYVGPLFKWARRYAEKFGDMWVILSAKYGFITPDFIIPGNYNVTFKDKKTNPISVDELKEQICRMGLGDYDEVVVIGGKEYVEVCKRVFPPERVRAPFSGLPLGKMISEIKRTVEMKQ